MAPSMHIRARGRNRTNVVERGDSSRGDHRKARQLGNMGICSHVDAGLHAIAGDVGIDQVPEALLGKLPHNLVKRQAHAIAPAVHLDLTIASGNVGYQQVAKAARRDLGKARLRYQNGTHGNALGAIPRKFIDACKRAHAARPHR